MKKLENDTLERYNSEFLTKELQIRDQLYREIRAEIEAERTASKSESEESEKEQEEVEHAPK